MKLTAAHFIRRIVAFLPFCLVTLAVFGQNSSRLSIRDFAIWGGSAPASTYNPNQGVVIRNNSTINGSIGSNHFVQIRNGIVLTGNMHSGNGISMGVGAQVNGNIFAQKQASNFGDTVISGTLRSTFNGNLMANGLIHLRTIRGDRASFVNGKVSVPAPSRTFYNGPVPTGGVDNNVSFSRLPAMPGITPFDDQVGTTDVVRGRVLTPGSYRNLELRGNQTITFDGPGNYIFNEVFNTGRNTIIFNFKNTTEGNINIYIRYEAQWGDITVRAINGSFESRIFTEVHGDGTKRRTPQDGVAFDMGAPGNYTQGNFLWLGNVWAPNGAIVVKGTRPSPRPHILGALWSGIRVDIREVVTLSYNPPPLESGTFVQPYYAPPPQGKVSEPDNIIGAELTSLASDPTAITSIPDNEIFKIENSEKVLIEVISKQPDDTGLKNALIGMGMTGIIDNGPHRFIITGFFPINLLTQLNSDPRIEYVRPWYPPVNNKGQVTTQGDLTMRTHLVRQQFGLDGSGVKIGVISDSYNNKASAQNDIDQGDLPGLQLNGSSVDNGNNVQVLQDLLQGGKDEGRAMLQIVHDIAPKANLAFRTGFLSAGDFAKGILELADPNLEGGGCDIIVDDLSYITEPFFSDGIIAQTVDSVVSRGVTYFTSAGNFGKKAYGNVFNGVSNPALFPAPALIHQFGPTPNDVYQSIRLRPGNYTIVLQWDEAFHSLGAQDEVTADLDLYIVGANNFRLFGFNRSNLFKDPFEVCPFTVTEETVARLMIVNAAGNTNVRFKYIIFRGDATILEYNNADSATIVGHANAAGAISVGAMLYQSFPNLTPVWPGVASFSSRGGGVVRDAATNTFVTRSKPDIIGPNGGNTTVDLGGAFFNDGDDFPNFFGTSAAAPHAAGLGALIVQARKKYNLQTVVTPDEVRQQIISSAGKFSHLGTNFSFEGGHGFIQGDSALKQTANGKPIIDSMWAEIPGGENGTEPFYVIIRGRYLSPGTQIYVNDVAVTTTVSEDGRQARALVNAIPQGEDPAFQLFNPAKSPSGLDGGFSDKKFFFSERRKVVVRPINQRRAYGQPNPVFEIQATINGVPISDPAINLTPADLKLESEGLTFGTIANQQSKAGLYAITVQRTVPLELSDPLNNLFEFEFQTGTLNVQKLQLRIVAGNQTLKYGEFPEQISYQYEGFLNGSWVPLADDMLAEVTRLHDEYMAKNGIILVNNFDDIDVSDIDESLRNMSTLASFQSVISSRKFVLENGQLRALVNNINPEEIGNQRFILDVPANALLNFIDNPESTTLTNLGSDDQESDRAAGLLGLKPLTRGEASAALPNGQLRAMVNGQLLGMVNGLTELANPNVNYSALINGEFVNVDDIVFQNGQLRALVNQTWQAIPNGQLRALVNGEPTLFELSVLNGQLRALVNGTDEMPVVNGQLRALVNGQEVSIVNGQLRALVNSTLVPLVNGDLMGIANGQLRALVNGEMAALINGQLMALIDGEYEEVTELSLVNGQLRALVNGQLRALVNGQLKAMVNGQLTDIDNTEITIVNGQLRAMVNGQLRAMVNGQLKALVNGQLKALVNSEAIVIEKMIQLPNGQLKALVNGNFVPVRNGQLRAMVNGQLRAMVNGEIMAEEENQLNFTVFENGQLKAMVNGQLRALVNGQLRAMVNGQLQPVDSYVIANGQLRALVNGEEWVFPNGQLKALVNGQLKALVNNFDISGTNNNAKTMVMISDKDLEQQQGDIGAMLSMALITGKNAGTHRIIPAALINENFEVSYEPGTLTILPMPVTVTTGDTTRIYGDPNPFFTDWSISELAYDETYEMIEEDERPFSEADEHTHVGRYPIQAYPALGNNYYTIPNFGFLTITPRNLTIRADNKVTQLRSPITIPPLTVSFDGLAGDDTKDSLCFDFITPASPKVINDYDRNTTYSDIRINERGNVFYATPGQELTLTGVLESVNNPEMFCPGCFTQAHVGMGDGTTNFFSTCYEVTGSGTTHFINTIFNAPATPGVYYITHINTWWFFCGEFPLNNHLVADLNKFAIAVVVVNETGSVSDEKIKATVDTASIEVAGEYPITVIACPTFNPNYTVELENGTLTVEAECSDFILRNWKGNGNFEEDNGLANGTPSGGVTADGEGIEGSNSFAFDGTGYIATGTAGSVEGRRDFSVSAWIKTTSNKPMVVIAQRDADNIDGEYILKIGGKHGVHEITAEDSGRVYFMTFENAFSPTVFELTGSTRVNDGNWHFIRAERIIADEDGSGYIMNIYVDGVLDATITTDEAVRLNSDIRTYIGADLWDNASYFEGLIDDVQVKICDNSGAETASFNATPARRMVALEPDAPASTMKIATDRLYPNPASNTIRIEMTEDAVSMQAIQVMHTNGKAVNASVRKLDAGVYEVNISNLAKGIYFVTVKTKTGIKTFKFVKI